MPCYSSLYSIRRTVHTRLAEKSASCSYIKPLFFVLLFHPQRSRTLWCLGIANHLEDNFLTRYVLTIVSVHGYLHFPTSSSGHM